ncbi:hypothetical protein O3M35_001156 [Rhynocoris fuscipes]
MEDDPESPDLVLHKLITPAPIQVESMYSRAEGVVQTKITGLTECSPEKSCSFKRVYTYFNDGIRTVDFVLVWDHSTSIDVSSYNKRKVFEQNLISEGLELEYEPVEPGGTLHFIKIHAPFEVLRRYSEILKLRMPMRKTQVISRKESSRAVKAVQGMVHILLEKFIYTDKDVFPDKNQRFTAIYSRDKEYLFDINAPNFFTQAVRSRIVQFIMDRTLFAEPTSHDMFVFGIERLLNSFVYSAAYPLHDGDLKTPGSMRYTLLNEWASLNKWHRYQPLDYVKEYFGVKIGLYFTWLGFYTHMLLPASLVGLACFIYSWSTLSQNEPSNDICTGRLDVKMCPLCDKFCEYVDLHDTCFHAKVTYLFDNYTTVFFAVFMSVWAVTFLELWKRYSAEMTHRWDLTGFDNKEEQPRPQYLARLEKFKKRSKPRVNVVTGVIERRVPFWSIRFPATILSFSVVLLLVVLALAAVLGVVLYRMSVLAALSVYGDAVISSYAILFTTTTAATINLICIVCFNWVYSCLAEYLTELEMLRTQTEFDDSLTLKMYLLQFVNYYASIFYIAFCKGKMTGYPAKYNRLFGYRQEECGPGGCLLELCIQLFIIMVGKQAFNTALEMILPIIYKWWHTRWIPDKKSMKNKLPQWRKDYKLVAWGHRDLFPEYLEMVLQYGFVTIFVSAFPLAPLFALINNVMEMRLDAKKLLTYHRRPVAQRVRSIGVWFRILDSISKLAVVTNGFIIAFTSDFIPRLVYTFTVSKDNSLRGFLNHSLSIMDTNDLDIKDRPNENVEYCRYTDYREPPWSPNKYEKTNMYWRVLAARLAFVVIFENIVVFVVLMVQWCIPDIPGKLKEQIRREAFITNEIIIHQEAERTRCCKSYCDNLDDDDDDGKDEPTVRSNGVASNNNTKPKWTKDFSIPPKDEALIHRPKSFGEISEVTV